MKDNIKLFTIVHELLKPYYAEILSIDIGSERISVHLQGKTFCQIAHSLKITPTGSWTEAGFHCGFEVPDTTIHLHSYLQ